MTSSNLENLVKARQLKREPGNQREFDGLVHSARVRVIDAKNRTLAAESRFDLAYNAAHALALAALRWNGYRSDKRYTVFSCLPHTLGVGPEVWRVLVVCHQRRNLAEYEGHSEIDEQLLEDLLQATDLLMSNVNALGKIN